MADVPRHLPRKPSQPGKPGARRRAAVLRLLGTAGRPLTAYDLLDRLDEDGARPAPPQIYRTLQGLERDGFVHRLASLRAYVLCAHPGHQHTAVFAVCDRCGLTQELEGGAVARALHAAAESQAFGVEHWVVEAHGACTSCRSQTREGGSTS